MLKICGICVICGFERDSPTNTPTPLRFRLRLCAPRSTIAALHESQMLFAIGRLHEPRSQNAARSSCDRAFRRAMVAPDLLFGGYWAPGLGGFRRWR